jgi:DNA-binding transcriptional LysR family regulator
MMEWSDVRIFLAVARTGTLGAAGRMLKLSHPTIGRRLRALEEATGQVLFQRTNDGLLLTDEGSAVLAIAEQMEANALTIERRLAGEDERIDGMLRITAADWFGVHVLPEVAAEFLRTHPQVTVELLTDTRFYSLSRREADVAFRVTPFDEPDVVQRRLLRLRYGLYAAKDAPDPVPGDGTGATIVTKYSGIGGYADIAWLTGLLPNAHVALRSNNRNVDAAVCAAGIGYAVLPRLLGDRLPALRRLDVGQEPPERELWIGYHRDMRRLGRLRAFLEIATRILAEESIAEHL